MTTENCSYVNRNFWKNKVSVSIVKFVCIIIVGKGYFDFDYEQ